MRQSVATLNRDRSLNGFGLSNDESVFDIVRKIDRNDNAHLARPRGCVFRLCHCDSIITTLTNPPGGTPTPRRNVARTCNRANVRTSRITQPIIAGLTTRIFWTSFGTFRYNQFNPILHFFKIFFFHLVFQHS